MNTVIQEISLAKLIPSAANVRKTGRKDGIGQLAASIKAHGLLQNLTVRKGSGDNKGLYEVVAGGRRLAALRKLAERKQIAGGTRIPCHVLDGETAEEISLAENVMQCPMHPADQYEAFAKLHAEQGLSAKEIGARFGVSAAVVKERLKLGAVSPKLIKLYREGKMNLDQLSAFTITDDHAAQERVWSELSWNKSREVILSMLTEGQVRADDRRARFVGAEAYQEAGGVITRDLFDAEGAGYFADAALLNHLVRDKLQRAAKKVLAEGWKWVSVEPEFDREMAAGMRRLHAALSSGDQEKLAALEAKRDELWDTGDDDNQDAAAELETIEAEIAALAEGEQYRPEDIAVAGAFVSLGHDGQVRIERGFVRPEDMKRAEAGSEGEGADGEDEAADAGSREAAPLSDRLAAELTSYRTSGLRNALAAQPATALLAVVHALAGQVFYVADGLSCLDLTWRSVSVGTHAPGIGESPAEREIAKRHDAWAKRLPDDPDALWEFLAKLKQPELLKLLAHCASLTVDAVRKPGRDEPKAAANADRLAHAVGLDMTLCWQPTAANYFGRVTKEQIAAAVREGVSEQAAQNIAHSRKSEMAAAAENLLSGKGWLPPILRTP
jgi:ParB family chromosome partitioning protein